MQVAAFLYDNAATPGSYAIFPAGGRPGASRGRPACRGFGLVGGGRHAYNPRPWGEYVFSVPDKFPWAGATGGLSASAVPNRTGCKQPAVATAPSQGGTPVTGTLNTYWGSEAVVAMAQSLIRVIVNPISGRGTDRRFLRDLEFHLRTRGYPVEIAHTTHAGHARELARSVPDNATAVVSIGGDGTHREVLSGLVGRPVPVCVVPSGTENVLARTFGLTGRLSEVLGLIQNGRRAELDVGTANGHPFIMFAGIGFDAAVAEAVHRKRRGRIWRHTYYVPIVRLWWRYTFPPLGVTVDGRRLVEDAGFVMVANTPQYADRVRFAPKAVADDGLLDVICFRTRTRWELLFHFLRTKLRNHLKDRRVIYAQGTRIEVDSNGSAVPVQADGDPILTTPVAFGVMPRAVRILVRPGRGA